MGLYMPGGRKRWQDVQYNASMSPFYASGKACIRITCRPTDHVWRSSLGLPPHLPLTLFFQP